MKQLMNQYYTQPINQRLFAFWQLCVLFLLLGSLAFINWESPRQTSDSASSALVADFEQLTLANHQREHFRSGLQPADSGGNEGGHDADQYTYLSLLQFTVSPLTNTVAGYSPPVLAAYNARYTLPLNRAPPRL